MGDKADVITVRLVARLALAFLGDIDVATVLAGLHFA
jgi:hypothetical protein